ncbi:hypothetical protein SAY86_022513 [Trapa natans]|uniref:AT-hook motif nuclear-localized protein n=1 Tax=Trapa natans TaxID=22666 RepID=A0AAN7RAQ7_TRANT|nr:hypothetical protein SAY86_022513 [Trapa natans]
MKSRENPSSQPDQLLPNMMMGLTSYHTASASHMINKMMNHHQHQQSHSGFPFVGPPSYESLDSSAATSSLYDGSSPPGFSIEPSKKKRGRPRKYAPPERNMALGLGPTSAPLSSGAAPPGSPSTEPRTKENKGKPPGSGKKQIDVLGTGGVGFTPHVIMVKAGEDIASKIVAFSQDGPRKVCILSANGAVSNFTLRQPSMPGTAATYEGRYEIISLTGSVEFPEDDNIDGRIGGLCVSLAGSDGHVIGGSLAGILTAAAPVQVVVGSFLTSKKKPSSNFIKSEPSSAPQSQAVNFGATAIMTPTSQDQDGSSQSSENRDGGNQMAQPTPGYYNEVSQPMPNMHMYHHHLWAGQAHR